MSNKDSDNQSKPTLDLLDYFTPNLEVTEEPDNNGEAITVLGPLKLDEKSLSPEQIKATSAQKIAARIIWFFGGAVALILGTGIALAIVKNGTSAEEAGKFVKEAVVPFLQGAANFLSTVFGNILAFILGYYFSEKQKEKASNKA